LFLLARADYMLFRILVNTQKRFKP
jgi:hypothetical protein